MVAFTTWAMLGNISNLLDKGNYFLAGLSGLILLLQAMVLAESLIIMLKKRTLPATLSVADEGEGLVPVSIEDNL